MLTPSFTLALEHYRPALDLRETEAAIKYCKDTFETQLAEKLNLSRVSAPLFVLQDSGINDTLNGVERAVAFDIKDLWWRMAEIVHSLAKWKRMALHTYGFSKWEGLYTDMNAIRRDEELDELHSLYVDQRDREYVISKEERAFETLKAKATLVYEALKTTAKHLAAKFPALVSALPEELYFITAQELEDLYPTKSPREREDLICREHKAVFLMQIGGELKSGILHDGRAPDYDDRTLNGDLLVYYPLMDRAFELSSMGIRVDETSLIEQLGKRGCPERVQFSYHKMISEKKLPYTIGGGIGQSRICMFLLHKLHIWEVQSSLWSDETMKICKEHNIPLL